MIASRIEQEFRVFSQKAAERGGRVPRSSVAVAYISQQVLPHSFKLLKHLIRSSFLSRKVGQAEGSHAVIAR